MTEHATLGPRVRRYRTSASLLAVVWYLSIGPLLVIVCAAFVVFLGRGPELIVIGAAIDLLLLVISIVFLAWCTSAYLDLHPEGVVLGRTVLGGRPRAMWFTEIHPASIRVFSDIDAIRPLRGGQRMLSPAWHFSPGADLAVTYLGPDPGGAIRRPAVPVPRSPGGASRSSAPARRRRSPRRCARVSSAAAARRAWRAGPRSSASRS